MDIRSVSDWLMLSPILYFMKTLLAKAQPLVWALISTLLLNACSDPVETPPGGKLKVEFDNVVGNKNLVLNSVTYQNAHNEDFTVTKLDYFISNIKLTKADGSVYTVPQDSSYFLIKESVKESQIITLNNVPHGDYKGIEFMVGVDSLRNTAPVEQRKGVLDPAGSMEDGMYWAWNSGYIFMKLEGTSPVGNPVNNKFYYHIGLFGGYTEPTVNNTRLVKLSFGALTAPVSDSKSPEVHLLADVLKVFNGTTQLSIKANNSIMGGQQELSQKVANNYATMFSVDHIH